MDRGAWEVAVHGVTRVGHDLVTKTTTKPYGTSLVAHLVKNPPCNVGDLGSIQSVYGAIQVVQC